MDFAEFAVDNWDTAMIKRGGAIRVRLASCLDISLDAQAAV